MKRWGSIALVSGIMLTGVSMQGVLAEEITNKALVEAVERRMDMGLDGDAELVLSYLEKDVYSEVWNIYMTEQEEQSIWERTQKQSDGMPLVDAFLEKNPAVKQNIKDRYIDQSEQGVFYLVLKDAKHESVPVLKEFIDGFTMFPVKISDKLYSERELTNMAEVFWEKKTELSKMNIEVTTTTGFLLEQKAYVGIKQNGESLKTNTDKLLQLSGMDEELLQVSFQEGMAVEPYGRGTAVEELVTKEVIEEETVEKVEMDSSDAEKEQETYWLVSVWKFIKGVFS